MICWYGHACFKVDKVLIDPFLPNPLCNIEYPKVVEGVKVIAVTHGHSDHIGSTVEISKGYNLPVVSNHEISVYLGKQGVNTEGMNIGGTVEIEGSKLTMVKAEHSSDIDENTPGGVAAGYIINDRVYHAGDTGLFGDMKLIGEIYSPKVALLPVGGRYTMGPEEAVKAVEFLNPKVFIPMHYNTFPLIEQDISGLVKDIEEMGVKVVVPKVGESLHI
ncbi:MAG TPA: metal-dependent hydrolase [Methanothermococcus okinawensis]|uniref:UPF0173 metal-dependent hydrolase EYH15_01650 n=1 Tax=Methanothermococcus okinawensis TaxID=155863 RepID=A0A833DZS0_9EURY|nr:metal-dependent hydrolase [Methanothermococcus okinawensis]